MLKGLEGLRHIHFVGIGGAGMSALAKILLEMGYTVSGSDKSSSPILEHLRDMGATVFNGHNGENVTGADAIVVSSAIPFDNAEVLAAYDLGIPKLHRSDINAALVNSKKGIAVAGAHGKTTTTSMIGVMLNELGVSPTVIIGGESPDLGTNALLGKGEYLVSEADESDGSFLKLRPYIAVVTNVENDHLDHYGTMDNIRAAFAEFIDKVDKNEGLAVLCFDNENLRNIAKSASCPYRSYAIDNEADYRAVNLTATGQGTRFDVMHGDENLGQITINIPGRHNVLDALATVVTGIALGLKVPDMAQALEKFHGAKRRFETKGRESGVWIVDDYAHHPTEIAATLNAAKETSPKRLICVFQPHRYSRTKLLHREFGTAFSAADELILTDIYSAGEQPIPGIDGTTILYDVKNFTGRRATYIEKREEIASYLADRVKDGDLVITMGAGDIYRTAEELTKLLQQGAVRKQ